MTKINELARADIVADNDLVPIWDTLNKDTRAATMEAVRGTYDRTLRADLAASTGSNLVGHIATGTGAVARTVQTKLREHLSVLDFGATGNGVTSDTAAVRLALTAASGQLLRFPKGVYRLPFSEVNGFSVPAGTVIEGDGKSNTELVLAPDSATYRNLFTVAANVTFRNIKITLSIPSTGSAALFVGDHTGLTVEDCYLDGGMTNSGATLSHNAYGISLPATGTAEKITVRGCDITRWRYFVLKTNTATSIQRRISFEHCDFFTNIGEDCSFNSPAVGSVMDDIQIFACRFRDSRATSASVIGLYVAFASCTNFRVGLCDFRDSITDAVHIEEASSRGTVTANTFNVDGNGIVIQDNNIGGTSVVPSDITVSSNSITKAGTAKAASTYGIWLVNDATPEVPAKRVVIESNTVANFFAGIQTGASGDDACLIADNIAHNCARGYGIMAFVPGVQDNTSSACDVGLVCDTSSMVLRHRFIECTTPVDAINRPAHVVDPMFLWGEFTVTGGSSVNKPTFALTSSDRVYGEWAVSAYCDAPADVTNRRNLAQWDGTTWTSTARFALEPGGITSGVNNTGGIMNIGVFAASTRANMRLAASFNGSVVIAV